MILTEIINIKATKANRDFYLSKGYIENDDKTFDISPYDLSESSHIHIIAKCDIPDCNNTKEISYHSYCLTMKKNGFYRCFACGNKAKKEIFMEKYGVDNPAKLPEIKEKQRQTNLERYGVPYQFARDDFDERKKQACLERYGVEHQLQSQEIKDKIKNTNMEKYGVEYCIQNEDIKERIKQTNLMRYGTENALLNKEIRERIKKTLQEKYGVENPLQSSEIRNKISETCQQKYGTDNPFRNPEIQEKIRNTMLEKYGVEHPIQNEEIHNKIINTNLSKYGCPVPSMNQDIKDKVAETCMNKYGSKSSLGNMQIYSMTLQSKYKNGVINTSIQQLYLNKIYGGLMNYPIKKYNADILIDNTYDLEFDGGGHRLCVKLGNMSDEEFDKLEIIRDIIINKAGYKIIRIISFTDKLPSDEILFQMLQDAKQYFSDYPNHSWIKFDIDNGIIRNAEHQEGVPYFYGKLRKIKKRDLDSVSA